MPVYEITAPDGRKFRVEGEGTQEEALAAVQAQYQPQQQAQGRTFGQELARQGGLAARYAIEGVAAIPAMVANVPAAIGNVLLPGQPFPEQNANISSALDRLGLPKPEGGLEEFVGSAGRAATGAGGSIAAGARLAAGGANTVASNVGRVLAAEPGLQAASAVTGVAGSEGAEAMGFGPVGQVVGGLAGAVAPSVAVATRDAAMRGLVRGGESGRQTVAQNLQSFREAGTTPTVGQATEGRAARAIEGLLSRSPGGAGPMVGKAQSQADELAANIEKQASTLARRASGEQAGRQIERSIRGEGGFVERFKASQRTLYDKLDEFIPNSQRVDVSKTQKALADLNAEIPGAPNVSKFFQNARIKSIQSALTRDIEARPELDDAAADILAAIRRVDPAKADQFQAEIFRDGKLPYEAVKKLRTLVGNELADSGIASDVPRSKWRALYAALSDDLGQAVEGNEQAKAAWNRANNYTRAGLRRIETIESVIDRNGGPEAIFRAATAGTREGATTLRAVMQSTDDEGRKMITATVLRRMGLAKPGQQDALGDQFSTETFLTNWNSLSTEAKATLFNRYSPGFRQDMDQVAKVASNLREGSQVFRNPSGTAQAQTQAATAGAFVLSLITGQLQAAGAIAGGVVSANMTARLMTNPRFVRWLAQSTKMPMSAYPSAVNRLTQDARGSGDMDLATVAVLLGQQSPQDVPGEQQRNGNGDQLQ